MSSGEQNGNAQSSTDGDSGVDPLRSDDTNGMISSTLMEEIVTFSTRQVLKRAALNAFWLPTVLASLFAGLGLVMTLGFTLAGKLPNRPIWWQIGALPVILFGGSWVMGFIVMAPMTVIVGLSTKHRRIRMEDGQLIQQTSCRTTKLSLDSSVWELTGRAGDIGGWYFGLGPLIQVQCDQKHIVCGFSEVKRDDWSRVLADSAAHFVVPAEGARLWLYGTATSLLTGCLGAALGVVLSIITNNRWWTASGFMIGLLDGVIVSLGLFYWARRGEESTQSRYGPFMCSLLFFLIGVKFAVGLDAQLLAGLANAVLGWFCGGLVTEKAKSLTMQAEIENPQYSQRAGEALESRDEF